MKAKAQKGFVLLTAIAVMVVLGMMGAVMVKHLTGTSELGINAMRFHQAKSALQSHINLFVAESEKEKGCSKAVSSYTWQQYEITIHCTLVQQGPVIQLDGTAKIINPNLLPVETSQRLQVKLII